jgi:hypothetical protein
MARPQLEKLPRVSFSGSVSASTASYVMEIQARLKKKNPKAKVGNALDSLAEFAKTRRFDPIASLEKILPPPSTAAGGKTATVR